MKKVIILLGICLVISILMFTDQDPKAVIVTVTPKVIGTLFIIAAINTLRPQKKTNKNQEDTDKDKKE